MATLLEYVKLRAGVDIEYQHTPRHVIYPIPETETERQMVVSKKLKAVKTLPRHYSPDTGAIVFHSGTARNENTLSTPFFGQDNHLNPRRQYDPALLLDKKIALETATDMKWDFIYPDDHGKFRPLDIGLLHTVNNSQYLWLKTRDPLKNPVKAYETLNQIGNPTLLKAAGLCKTDYAVISAATMMELLHVNKINSRHFSGKVSFAQPNNWVNKTRGDDDTPGFYTAV